uniref:ESPR-type extended signal peptide-containing protein n=1 Tax=Acinetobacter courvalinii TaxID=280147 RepID=UPI0021CDA854|nr:ESPR-type extended signal peptide-containing protein [Acinetobacter courvalinii]
MNKIYRLVWNKSLQLWTVVSEIARGVSKNRNVTPNSSPDLVARPEPSSESQFHFPLTILATLISSALWSGAAFAGYEAGGGSTYTNCTQSSTGSGSRSINSIAVGNQACATANGSMAMGSQAYARGPDNVSMGTNARTGNTQSPTADGQPLNGGGQIAIGKNAFTDTAGSIAIGAEAKTGVGQHFGVAIGGYADASGNSAVAFGRNSKATGWGSTSVGPYATSNSTRSLAVGNESVASAENAVSVGVRSNASARDSIALGLDTQASGVQAGAMGARAVASGENSTALGVESQATGKDSNAIGAQTVASGEESAGVGFAVQASGKNSFAGGSESKATATSATVIGYQSEASGENSFAGGSGAKATAKAATAVGYNTQATGENSFASGNNSQATGLSASAVGANTVASGEGSFAGGSRSNARGLASTALGAAANALTDESLALGARATSSGEAAIAVGNFTTASGDHALSVGGQSLAAGEQAVSMGYKVQALGTNATAVGSEAQATDTESVALGYKVQALASNTLAAGSQSIADKNGASAMGHLSEARGEFATAAGAQAWALADRATALGYYSRASGEDDIAIGSRVVAEGKSSIAIGTESDALAEKDIAIGANATTAQGNGSNISIGTDTATGNTGQNIAMGYQSNANAASSTGGAVAIGREQKATGDGAVAIGDPNTANGNGAVATGRNNTAAGDTAGNTAANGAVAIGNENQAIGQGSVALGNTSTAAAAGAVALGDTANAQAANGVALGSNAVATNANDVALGSGSQTSTATGTGYRTGTAAPSSVVSVGTAGNERRIQNLSDGSADTDAVNVRQLRNVQEGVDQLGQSTADALGGGSSYDPTTGAVSNPTYNINGTDTNNVGDALAELDKGWTLQSNGANAGAVKAGDTVDIGTVDGEENLQVAKDGNNIKYSLNRDLKVDSVTAGDTVINNDGMTITGGPSVTKDGIDAAGTKVTNVADGTDATDAVNKGQLDQASQDLTDKGFGITAQDGTTIQKKLGEAVDVIGADPNISTKVANGQVAIELSRNLDVDSVTAGDTVMNMDGVSIANGPSMTKSGIDAAGNKVTNVADGDINPDSTDAINGSQLAKNAQSVSDALGGGSTVNPDGTVSNPTYNINGTDTNNVGDALAELDKGWTLQSNGANSGAVKAGDTVDIGTADGEENLQVAKEGNDIKYSLNRDLKVDSVTTSDTVINNDGMTIVGGPSVTKDGIDATGTKVTNVADGTDATDAVNKGQLDQASQDLTDKGFGLRAQDGTTVQKKLGEAVDVVGADPNISTKVENGQVAIELSRNLDIDSVTAGDTVMNTDGVSIASGPSMTKSGIDAAGNKVTNVADGDINPDSTDAINGSQLYNTAQSTADALGGGSTVNPDGTVSNPTYNINGTDTNNVGDALAELDKGWTLQSNGANDGAVKAGDTVDIGTADGEENLQVAKDGNNIKYSLNRDLKVDSVTAGDTVINNDGITITGGPSVTKDGIDAAGTKVTNVADGTDATDAVNKGQLDQASQDLTDKGFGITAQDGSTVQKKLGEAVDVVGADPNISTKVENGQVAIELSRDLDVDSVTAGDTVMNTDGVTIANGPSMTKSGIDAAGNKVTNVAAGTEGTDAVNVDQLKTSTAASKTEVEAGKNITVDSTTGADGQTIYTVATADDVEFNSVKVGDVNIDGATGKISGIAAGDVNPDSTDAINGSQLAQNAQSTADALGGGSTVNPDGTVSNPTYNINGTDTNNVGDALAELDKGWTLQSNDANSGAVKAGDTVDIGTADGEENLQVTKEGNDIKYSLNRDLKVDSVTAGDTVINNDGVTITGGPSVTKSGIDAAGNKISNVAPGTVSADSKDAINGSQLHAQGEGVKNIIGGNTQYDPDTGIYTNPDIGGTGQNNINDAIGSISDAATKAKTTVTQGDNIVVTESKNSDGSSNYEVATAKDVNFDSVNVGDVNIDGATGKISGVAAGAVNPDSTDAINGSQLANNAQSVADALGGGSTVNPDGTVTNPSYNINGTDTNNVGDALAELDKGWTLQSNGANDGAVRAGDTVDIGTADGEENLKVAKEGNNIKYNLNRNLKVDSVTAGDTVINNDGMSIAGGPSMTKSGIDVAGNKISNVAAGTDGTDAVNKDQLDQATAGAKNEVDAGKNMTVNSTTGADGQTIYTVATADDVEFNSVKVGDVNIDGTTGKISGVAAGDVNPDSTDAVNGSQLANNAQSVADALGGGSSVNPDGTVSAPNYNVNGTSLNNVGDAITELDKGWTLQSNGANSGAVKAGDAVDIGTADGEENLQVAKDGNNIKYSLNRDLKVDSVTAGDSVINNDGMTITGGPSVTKSGIDAAGNKIINVAPGTVSADSSEAINGSQLHAQGEGVKNIIGGNTQYDPDTGTYTNPDIGGTGQNNINDAIGSISDAATKAKTTVTQGDNIVVTESKNSDGSSNYEVATAKDVNFDSVNVGDVNIDGSTGKISGVAAGDVNPDSTDAVNGSQLANNAQSVADALGGGSAVNPDGTVSAPKYTVNGNNVSNVGDAITELDKGWTLQSNGANAGAVKAGDTVDIGTADDEENLQVAKEGNSIKYSLSRDLNVDSVTAGDTLINTDGMIISGGPSVTKSGIDVAGNKISNVAAGTDGTDAVNKDQLDQATTGARTEVDAGKNMTVNSTTGADGQTIYTVATADDVEFNSVKVGDVNIDGSTGKISGVTAGDVTPDSTDAVNGSQLANNAQSVADALGGGSSVNPDGTVSAPNYNVNGTSLNNVGDAITELDKGWTLQSNGANSGAVKAGDTVDIGTADGEENLQVAKEGNNIKYSLNRDLKVDSVTAGDTVINNDGMTITGGPSITKAGINAGNNKITGVAPGTVSADSSEAINGSQLHAQGEGVKNIIGGNTQYDPDTGTYTNPDIGGTGQNNINDAIGSIGKAAAAAKTEVEAGKNMTVDSTTGADGQTIYTVATADDVEFNSVKVGDVNIDGTTGKISGVAAGDINPDSTDAVNGSQLANNAQSVADALGGGSAVNPDGTVSAPKYTVNGNNVSNVGDAITELDKGWTLQSNGANAGAVKAGDTVDIGTADDEENLQVAKEGNSIKYSLSRDLNVDSVTAGDTLINTDGMIISGGPSVTKAGINAGNKKITGVALGTVSADSTEAINGSQLHAQGEGVKNIIGGNTQYDPNTGKYTNPDIGGTGKDNINDAIGAVGDAAKAAKSTVSNKDGNITVNETTKPDGSRDYEVGLAKDIKVDSVTAGGTKVDGDGLHIEGGPSVTKDGIDAGDKKVTGVADGTVAKDSKDAVNGGQLKGVSDSVANVIGGNTTVNPDGSLTTSDIGGTGKNNVNDAIESVKNDAKAAKTTVSKKDDNLTVNKTQNDDGSTNYEVGLADKIKVKQVDADQVNVAGDQGKTSISGGGISITGPKGEQGPSMTTGGINAGGKKVTGVADGAIAKDSQDAINGSQLHQSYQDVGAALGGGAGYDPAKGWTGPSYEVGGAKHDNVGDALGALDNADKALGDRITNLGDQMQQAFYDTNQRIDDVKKHANAGVAAAMALETAPYISGKYTYAVGAAYHGGENAVGVTLRKTADNGRWSLTTGVAAASQGDPSFRVGLSGVFD